VRDWLSLQRHFSSVPAVRELLIETFPRGGKHYMVCYPFEGRLAHQTLGMLLTRRLERARARPLGFVANEYALAIWGLGDVSFMVRHGKLDFAALFAPDMLGDDLEAWLAESALMKRTFRNCALISGLIPRRFTGDGFDLVTNAGSLFVGHTKEQYSLECRLGSSQTLLQHESAGSVRNFATLDQVGSAIVQRLKRQVVERTMRYDHQPPFAYRIFDWSQQLIIKQLEMSPHAPRQIR